LFKLPREIRDNIYAYYVHDENGVHYQLANDGSGCMLQSNKMPLNTSLKSTCSRVALEMKSLSIYTNTIHFFPGNKHSTHCAMLSDALRFKRLLEAVNAAKWHMLLLCRSMVRLPKIIDEAARVHSAPDFKDFFQALRDGLGEPMHAFRAGRWYSGHEKYSLASRSALQYALNLASKEPQFEELIREESTFPLRDPEAMMQHHSKFIRGVHSALLDWNPAPWSIPKDEDLFILESMLWNRDDVANLRRDNYADKIDWKFSACALASQRQRIALAPRRPSWTCIITCRGTSPIGSLKC
jgi:hypothetical protein